MPGISTVFAVAARLKTPLTDRSSASKLILATAHHAAGKVELAPSWQGAFPDAATLVLYMPGRDFSALSTDLIASGIAPETLCIAVSRATTRDEEVCATTVGSLPDAEIGPAPVLLLIGRAIQAS